MCDDFGDIVLYTMALKQGLAYLITGINFVLRTICIMAITWIGYKTETV